MLQLKMMSTQLEYNKGKDDKEIKLFQIRKQDYLSKEKQFDEDDQRLAEQYSQQIWKQINQYVSDYGKENNFSFIYGASGNGAIMYAQDKYDVTIELTSYINEKYKGEKK
jgi:outer membrane protein